MIIENHNLKLIINYYLKENLCKDHGQCGIGYACKKYKSQIIGICVLGKN